MIAFTLLLQILILSIYTAHCFKNDFTVSQYKLLCQITLTVTFINSSCGLFSVPLKLTMRPMGPITHPITINLRTRIVLLLRFIRGQNLYKNVSLLYKDILLLFHESQNCRSRYEVRFLKIYSYVFQLCLENVELEFFPINSGVELITGPNARGPIKGLLVRI